MVKALNVWCGGPWFQCKYVFSLVFFCNFNHTCVTNASLFCHYSVTVYSNFIKPDSWGSMFRLYIHLPIFKHLSSLPCNCDNIISRVNNRRESIQLPYISSKMSLLSMVCLLQLPQRRCEISQLTSGMHTGFVLSFGLKVMISSCQHFYNNLSFTGVLDRLTFDRVYDSCILSLLLFTLDNIGVNFYRKLSITLLIICFYQNQIWCQDVPHIPFNACQM